MESFGEKNNLFSLCNKGTVDELEHKILWTSEAS